MFLCVFRVIQAHMGGHTLLKKQAHQPLQPNTCLVPLVHFTTSPHMHSDYILTVHIYIPLTKTEEIMKRLNLQIALCAQDCHAV